MFQSKFSSRLVAGFALRGQSQPRPGATRAERLRSVGLSRWMLLAALPWAGALPSALADEPAYESMSLEELLQVPVVVTASRQDEAVTDAPATTVVITREEIRLRGYAFLKDVLRDLPGMETQEYFNSQIGTRVPVRGQLGNHKIIVLVNGMRVNPPGGENMVFRSDISVRDADQIEVDLWNSYATSAAPRGGEPTYLAGQIPTPWEMNAHILYSPIPSLDLYADFRNLTDHKYYLVASNTNSPTNSTSNGPYPIHHFREPVVCEWCSREDGVSC